MPENTHPANILGNDILPNMHFTRNENISTPSSDTALQDEIGRPQRGNITVEGEPEEARIERLGRQRPEKLSSLWKEIGFVFSIAMSQVLTEYFVSGFTVLVPTVVFALDIPADATTWPVNAFSLVVSSFLLPFGRLADIYGGFAVYLAGCAWCCVLSLMAGFSRSAIMLDVMRALQGLGPAAYLPASLTLLGSMYRPGPRKNLVFSIYGAMAPFGFFLGIFFAGVVGEYAGWQWYFFIGTILTFITTIVAYWTIPSDFVEHKHNRVKMDWLGSITTAPGLILLVFAVTDCSHAPNGWATPYIIITFVSGLLLLGVAFYIEGWIAEQPLLPFDAFKINYMRPFVLGLIFAYSTLGIYILYATLYLENIIKIPPMLVVAWYVPMAIGGMILATLGGLILHRIPGTVMMGATGIAIMIDSLLFALAPHHANYWAWVFPAMICATIAIDLIFNVANIFFSTMLPARQQGLAGALANVLIQLSIALFLGVADIVVSSTAFQGQRQSYKNAFWFEFACGGTALAIFMGFVRIGRAKSDYTADEKEETETLHH